MIKIPESNKTFSIPNTSDQSGNIWYTKNINFDEKGYLKLSSRAVSIVSSDEDAHFGYPYSIGRQTLSGNSGVVTSDYTFQVAIANTGITVTNDGLSADIPVGSVNNRGVWWQNKFHVTTDTSMKSRDGVTGTWASTGVSLTTGYPHPLEVFRNKVQLAVGNGNVVKLFTTAYAAGTADLTIPVDYTVTCLSYQNQRMAIGTQLNATVAGQNQEAYLFIWDGATTAANSMYGVGSDAIMCVKAYKSSWVLLTRNGKLLYFNGGGFETLATLPFFFKKYTVGTSSMVGDIMEIQGDLIYLNLPADINYYGIKQERFLQNFNGGILCFDPAVGLYSRYSASVSKLYSIQSGSANVSTVTGTITATSGTLPQTGNQIMYTSDISNPIGGLTVGTVYYIIRVSSTTFRLAATKANAMAGINITLTSTGAAAATFLGLLMVDYGSSKATVSNAVINMGNQNYNYDHLMFGGYFNDYDSTSPYQNLNITIPQFLNRGYFVTPRINSDAVEDNTQKIYIKYKPLNINDSIIIKAKTQDVVGLPVSTEQRGKTCTWTSTTVFTTTADFSEAYTYMQTTGNESECEIISGAGSGSMPQIVSIEYSTGTYTVTLAEEVEGISVGYKSDVLINNWALIGTITSTDIIGHKEFAISIPSKWIKFKIELRGVETTVEELQIISKVQLASV